MGLILPRAVSGKKRCEGELDFCFFPLLMALNYFQARGLSLPTHFITSLLGSTVVLSSSSRPNFVIYKQ